MTIIAAADGSALGNPGPAGWAWYIDDSRWRCGGWKRGTNNQGELTAVLDLLRQTAHVDEPLHILCDSQYVINSVTKWMAGWKRKGWKKADGKPVLNVELMKALDEAMQGRNVTFEWVKGHAGHDMNEKADQLANGAAKAHAAKKTPDAGPGFPGATGVGAGEDPAAPPAAGQGTGASTRATTTRSTTTRATTTTTTAPPQPAPADEPDLFSFDGPASGSTSDSTAGSDDIARVVDLERSLLTDAVRRDREQLETLLDPAWSHVCARGEVWSLRDRLAAADEAARTAADKAAHTAANPASGGRGDRTMELIESRAVGSDSILLVWREHSEGPAVLRSSVWVRSGTSWRQTFQQGTREA